LQLKQDSHALLTKASKFDFFWMQVEPDSEVWSHLVSLAGHANRPDLAAAYFNAAQSSRAPPSSHTYNAMLSAMAKSGVDLDEVCVCCLKYEQ